MYLSSNLYTLYIHVYIYILIIIPFFYIYFTNFSHPGSFTIVNVKDATGNVFATRDENIFVIGVAGDDYKSKVTLPKAKGIALTILEERKKMFKDM